ncbi:MAG: 30S ribosomal protein S25 [Nitrososphaerota archaeon]
MGGGTKKKSLSAMERMQKRLQEKEGSKAAKQKGAQQAQKPKLDSTVAVTKLNESLALKALQEQRALTVHGLARALGIKASLANQLLRSLVAKGLAEVAGGYSGHYIFMAKA